MSQSAQARPQGPLGARRTISMPDAARPVLARIPNTRSRWSRDAVDTGIAASLCQRDRDAEARERPDPGLRAPRALQRRRPRHGRSRVLSPGRAPRGRFAARGRAAIGWSYTASPIEEIGSADLDHGIGVRSRQRQAIGLVPGPLGALRITLRQAASARRSGSRQSGIVDSCQVMSGGRPADARSPVGVPASIPTPRQACAQSDRHAPRGPVHRSMSPSGRFGVATVRDSSMRATRDIQRSRHTLYAVVADSAQRRTVSNSGEPVRSITRPRRVWASEASSRCAWTAARARQPLSELDGRSRPLKTPSC